MRKWLVMMSWQDGDTTRTAERVVVAASCSAALHVVIAQEYPATLTRASVFQIDEGEEDEQEQPPATDPAPPFGMAGKPRAPGAE